MQPGEPQDLDYSRVMGRIARLIGALALLGCAVWYVVRGWPAVASFVGGAAVSSLSLWLLHRMVADVTALGEGRRVAGGRFVFHAFRLIILGAATYGIVGIYGSDRLALVTGLVLAVTAATAEVLIELFYARA